MLNLCNGHVYFAIWTLLGPFLSGLRCNNSVSVWILEILGVTVWSQSYECSNSYYIFTFHYGHGFGSRHSHTKLVWNWYQLMHSSEIALATTLIPPWCNINWKKLFPNQSCCEITVTSVKFQSCREIIMHVSHDIIPPMSLTIVRWCGNRSVCNLGMAMSD